MNHTRAVSAKHVASASVAAAGTWRVSVGGDRVEDMAPDAILRAFQDGRFNLRTPLWPPGATGWQALGNFAELQAVATDIAEDCADAESAAGTDDAPSESGAFSRGHSAQHGFAALGGPAATDSRESANSEPAIRVAVPHPITFFSARPTQRVPPLEHAKATAPIIIPVWLPPIIHRAAPLQLAIPSSPPEFRPKNRRWWLLPGLIGLILFGSAMLTTRNNLAALAAKREQALHKPSPPVEPAAPLVVEPAAPLAAAPTATDEPAPPAAAAVPAAVATTDSVTSAATPPDTGSQASASLSGAAPSKAAAVTNAKSRPNGWARARAKRAGASHRTASVQQPAPLPGPEPSPVELQLISSAPEELTTDSTLTSRAVLKAAAREALQSARGLASSCQPNGGPSGPGRVRVIYSPDGNVQSVEILTEKFRDTTTGSCVRMVFRRAKIAAFQGEPTTFLADFAIPE